MRRGAALAADFSPFDGRRPEKSISATGSRLQAPDCQKKICSSIQKIWAAAVLFGWLRGAKSLCCASLRRNAWSARTGMSRALDNGDPTPG